MKEISNPQYIGNVESELNLAMAHAQFEAISRHFSAHSQPSLQPKRGASWFSVLLGGGESALGSLPRL